MSALPIIDSTHSHFINPARITLTIENVLNETAYEFVDFSLPNGDITLSLTCAHCDPLISLDETKIFLFLHSCIKEKVSIQYRISIINADGDKCHTQDGRFFGWNMKEKSCGELCQIESDYLFDPANGLLVDNKLTVYCEVEEIVGEHQMSCLFPHWNRISEDYQFILESGNMSDAVLVVGEKELRVHKLVLSTRSPVFAAMFAHPTTKEARENRVEIVDVDVEVMELLLKYIYTP